jgi:O-antigen/teichoic acid export membrane protein
MRRISISDLKNKHFLSLAGNAVIAVFSIIQMGILLRSLDKTAVGIWMYFLTVFNLGDAVRSGLLGTATIKFYAGTTPQRAAEVLGSVWILAFGITGILLVADGIALMSITKAFPEELAISIRWFGITLISSLPFTFAYWKLAADETYDRILLLRLVNNISMIIYIIVLIVLKQLSLQSLLLCNLITNCLASVVAMALGYAPLRTVFKRTRATVMMILNYGKYSLGSTAVSKLLSSTDTFFISVMLGPANLAIYSIPQKLMEIVEFPLRSFVATGMSGMANAFNQNNEPLIIHIFKKYSGMLTMAFIPLTLGSLLFADFVIGLLGGGQYVGTLAANVFRILMVLALLYPIDRFSGVTLDIIHQPKYNFYKVLVMLGFAILGNYVGLVLFKNLYGIALGSFLTISSGAIFGYLILNKYLKIPLREVLSMGFSETIQLLQRVSAFKNKK